ncbi:hypothetical protein JW872_00575 [Candidatus Babeliales bacterium]|nr:hypothetical protein [Candidatus Babeliales bacterium]
MKSLPLLFVVTAVYVHTATASDFDREDELVSYSHLKHIDPNEVMRSETLVDNLVTSFYKQPPVVARPINFVEQTWQAFWRYLIGAGCYGLAKKLYLKIQGVEKNNSYQLTGLQLLLLLVPWRKFIEWQDNYCLQMRIKPNNAAHIAGFICASLATAKLS